MNVEYHFYFGNYSMYDCLGASKKGKAIFKNAWLCMYIYATS